MGDVPVVQAAWATESDADDDVVAMEVEACVGQDGSPATSTGGERPATQQTALDLVPVDRPFVTPQHTAWTLMKINAEYVPAIGSLSDRATKCLFAPKPYSAVLAMDPPCARGKSTSFHGYMKTLLQTKPGARVLLLSANILYGTTLTADLRRQHEGDQGVNVGFYREREEGSSLSDFNVVVCSLESLHHLDEQRFDAILIDEIRSIARLVGGGTMSDFNNVYLLRELCARSADIVVCDADLTFKIDDSEPNTLTHDFMELIMPGRPVLHASLSHPGPDHLRRGVKLLFDYGSKKKGNPGKKRWFEELEAAAAAWHTDNSKRFAVCVGSKTQLGEVYEFLKNLKVLCKPYSGDTDENAKLHDLTDADSAWVAFGCIASTTSLSIGVDPKTIAFDRVFMWTHRNGCLPLAMFQAAMRFGRQAEHPLGNQTVWILAQCIPPGVRAAAVRLGKMKPLVHPTFEQEFKRLAKRRGASARTTARELAASGGRPLGVTAERTVSDQIIRVMAHSHLELKFRKADHYASIMRCIQHYRWRVEAEPGEASALDYNLDEFDVPDENEDDNFAVGTKELAKWEYTLDKIAEDGEEPFFIDCYGLVSGDNGSMELKTSVQQYLVKAYWLLRYVERLPRLRDGVEPAEQMVLLHKPGVLSGLQLNATARCMSAETAMQHDNARRCDPDKIVPHTLLKPAVGVRMNAAYRLAKLLGLERHWEGGDLPDRVVQIARREAFTSLTEGDRDFIKQLKLLVGEMQDLTNITAKSGLLGLLGDAALLLGLALEGTTKGDKERKTPPNARAKDGRVYVVKFLRLARVMPDIVDEWKIFSNRLGFPVCTENWAAQHATLDEEEGAMGLEDTAELDAALYARPTNMGDQRYEKIDASALTTQLQRLCALRDRDRLTKRDKRWLDFLIAADVAADPADANGIRWLAVVYGKNAARVIGRRTASHPSMQHCPSGLRPLLVAHYYHDVDIVNCHPTLMLQVAETMGVPERKIARLREYVTNRQAVLDRIGHHYGIPAGGAAGDVRKFGVLRVLNLGAIASWVNDADTGCTRNKDETQADLRDLAKAAEAVHEAFFEMPQFKETVNSLRAELTTTTKAKVQAAQERVRAAANTAARERAQTELGNARRKASTTAIDRSCFSACIFELEDQVLMKIVESFGTGGWTVSSFQFDGLHAEHRPSDTCDAATGKWVALEAAMRAAEQAVEKSLGYKIKLTEKALFEANTAAEVDDDFTDDF